MAILNWLNIVLKANPLWRKVQSSLKDCEGLDIQAYVKGLLQSRKQPEQPHQLLNSSQKYKVKPLPNVTAVNIPRFSVLYTVFCTQ